MLFGKSGKLTAWGKFSVQTYSSFSDCHISKKSVLKLFGYSSSAGWLAEYVMTFQKFTAVPDQLIYELTNSQIVTVSDGQKDVSQEVYKVGTLFQLCDFIQGAKEDGYIGFLDLKIATISAAILSLQKQIPLEAASANFNGLNFYKQRQREKVAKLLADASGSNSYIWIEILPDRFLQKLMQLHHYTWENLQENLSDFATLVQRNLFLRLPIELRQELEQNEPKRSYRRKNHQPQRIGNDRLEEVITIVSGLITTSQYNQEVLSQLLDKIYPLQDLKEVQIAVPAQILSANQQALKDLIF